MLSRGKDGSGSCGRLLIPIFKCKLFVLDIFYKSLTYFFPIMHPNTQAVPYVWIVAVQVGAPARDTTSVVRSSDRVLGATKIIFRYHWLMSTHTAARRR